MSEPFHLYSFPNEERKDGIKEPENKKSDQSTIAGIDRGYRRFWRKRGKKPPPVSSHFIQMPEEWD